MDFWFQFLLAMYQVRRNAFGTVCGGGGGGTGLSWTLVGYSKNILNNGRKIIGRVKTVNKSYNRKVTGICD